MCRCHTVTTPESSLGDLWVRVLLDADRPQDYLRYKPQVERIPCDDA
jgi:hypothetical protein